MSDFNEFLSSQSPEVLARAEQVRRQRREAESAQRRTEEWARYKESGRRGLSPDERDAIREKAQRHAATAPPLTDEQREFLRRAFKPGAKRRRDEIVREFREDVAEAHRQLKAERHTVPIATRLTLYAGEDS